MCRALGQDVILDVALYKFGIFIYLVIYYLIKILSQCLILRDKNVSFSVTWYTTK